MSCAISAVPSDASAFVHRDAFLGAFETNLRMPNLTTFIHRPAYSQHSSAEAPLYDSPPPEFSFIGNALISLAPLSRRLSSTSSVSFFFRYTSEAIDLKIVNVVLPPNRSANGSAASTRPPYRRITSSYSDASAPFNLRIHPGPSSVVTLAVPSDASAFVHRDAFLGAFETNLRMPNLTTFIHRPAYSQHSSAEAHFYDSPPPEFSFIGNALISLAPLSRRLSSTFTVPIFFRYTAQDIDLKIVNVVLPPNRSANGSAASIRPSSPIPGTLPTGSKISFLTVDSVKGFSSHGFAATHMQVRPLVSGPLRLVAQAQLMSRRNSPTQKGHLPILTDAEENVRQRPEELQCADPDSVPPDVAAREASQGPKRQRTSAGPDCAATAKEASPKPKQRPLFAVAIKALRSQPDARPPPLPQNACPLPTYHTPRHPNPPGSPQSSTDGAPSDRAGSQRPPRAQGARG
ncbi:hypothetical protein JB92DRAFT_1766894 [Gautieria morchelliformis]|nr:hypothetical protein JB92DRAFT_1766894 [Gautieria morchelliformis]